MDEKSINRYFAGKKVTVMGLGLLGRGVGDAEFLAQAGAEVTVTDLKSAEELRPSMERLAGFSNVVFHLGGHRMEDFENRDLILRAPNAPLDSPYLARARELGIPIEMDASLFLKLSGASAVGVTGTRGKSTVTHMIYAAARAAGLDPLIGGNERGVATLPLVREAGPGRLAVLELDSWQLQGFAGNRLSPHVAIWTNFMPDHMNYYHGDMERYFEDKAAIARFQKPGDVFITSPEILSRFTARFGRPAAECVTVGGADEVLPTGPALAVPGGHNLANAAFAFAAARALGIADGIIAEVLADFRALPGRLEYLGDKGGAAFYNDSNSTTPEAALAALSALAPEAARRGGRIVLIAGGSDKDLDLREFAAAVERSAKRTVLFRGAATEKLLALLSPSYASGVTVVQNMADAVSEAAGAAVPGDIVLLSPAATSFGIFKNEYDRGDRFRELFEKLK